MHINIRCRSHNLGAVTLNSSHPKNHQGIWTKDVTVHEVQLKPNVTNTRFDKTNCHFRKDPCGLFVAVLVVPSVWESFVNCNIIGPLL